MRFFLAILSFQLCYGASLHEYFDYIDEFKEERGSYENGEIEIVVDPIEIEEIENVQKNRLIRKGYSIEKAAEYSKVGIVSEDQYLIWVRDAVYFPKRVPGTYDRLIWKVAGGVAVLPILPSGQVVLNLNFRHATRSWELELPRGGLLEGESEEEGAIRELKEETGLGVESVIYLGSMAADSGILSSVVPVYLGVVSNEGAADREYSEAIEGTIPFSLNQLKEALIAGSVDLEIKHKKQSVQVRDPFLTFALLQAQFRELL